MTDEEHIRYRSMLGTETKFDTFCRVLSNVIPWALVIIAIAGAIYKLICVNS